MTSSAGSRGRCPRTLTRCSPGSPRLIKGGARQREQGAGAHLGLGEREERYLRSVVALSERARRLRRRIAAGAFAALSAIALVVSLLAVRAGREAKRARAEAARADHEAALAQE